MGGKAEPETIGSVCAFLTRSSRSLMACCRPRKPAPTAVIQPGGSVRDDEVIKAADEADLAMVFTGMRHFRHSRRRLVRHNKMANGSPRSPFAFHV